MFPGCYTDHVFPSRFLTVQNCSMYLGGAVISARCLVSVLVSYRDTYSETMALEYFPISKTNHYTTCRLYYILKKMFLSTIYYISHIFFPIGYGFEHGMYRRKSPPNLVDDLRRADSRGWEVTFLHNSGMFQLHLTGG